MTSQIIDRLVSVINAPTIPLCSGTVKLPSSSLVVIYGALDDLHGVGLHGLGDNTAALDALQQACQPATFGRNQEDVLDESYRKAGKMDADRFKLGFDVYSAGLVDAIRGNLLMDKEKRPVVAELYKLNVYGKGSFFKAHKDTPRAENMFGSLVVTLPAPHEGGALVFRHQLQEWTFNSAKIFADLGDEASSHIAFVAFYSDVEHEVLPVTAGHRLTVTWNLYYGTNASVAPPPPVLRILEPSCASESKVGDALEAIVKDARFLPDGGLLGFALRHEYAVSSTERRPLAELEPWLKGSDAALFAACKGLGLRPSLRAVLLGSRLGAYVMFPCPPDLKDVDMQRRSDPVEDLMLKQDGEPLRKPWACLADAFSGEGAPRYSPRDAWDGPEDSWDRQGAEWDDCDHEDAKTVYWVTKPAKANMLKERYMAYGNEAQMATAYTKVCLVADVPAVGERL